MILGFPHPKLEGGVVPSPPSTPTSAAGMDLRGEASPGGGHPTDWRALTIALASTSAFPDEWREAAQAAVNVLLLDYEAACEASYDKPHDGGLRLAAEAACRRVGHFHEARDKDGDEKAVRDLVAGWVAS